MSAKLTFNQFRKMSAAKRASHMFRKSSSWAFEGSMLAVPVIALSTAMADRGEKVPTAVATTASIFTYPAYMGVISAGLSLLPGVGRGTAMFLAFFAAMHPTSVTEGAVNRSVRTFTRLGSQVRSLEMGRSFIDSELAINNRLRAIQDMNGSLINSRRYLGQEARLLHR
jgi:hypothetical protein